MTIQINNDDRDRIRAQFPALAGDTVYLENAGGSQVPVVVADRIHDYMLNSYVQVGAGYPVSQRATRILDEAHDFVRLMLNGEDGEVILGPSSSALLQMLAGCYAEILEPGSEIVVAQTSHEANVGPWKKLAGLGLELRWWEMDPTTYQCPLSDLESLLSDRTALVAFPHVSNLLGEIVEDSAAKAAVRRFLTNLVPQSFHMDIGGTAVGIVKQFFNPFVLKYEVDFGIDAQGLLDRRLAIGAVILLLAIEGRQR